MIIKNVALSFNNMYHIVEDIEATGITVYDADGWPTKNLNTYFYKISDVVIHGKIVSTGRPVRFSLLAGKWEIPASGKIDHYIPKDMCETDA